MARVDAFGMPLYLATENVNSAATIGTSKLWTGGSTGLNLDGSATNVKGKLAVWDGGSPLTTHVEFAGRINQKDNADISDHSTHVAGTMIAKGINPASKGMSHGIQELIAYDMLNNSDIEEMMAEGSNLLVSNHSYGFPAGWQYNDRWEFYGPPNSTEDYKFGYYSAEAQLWDSIAYNAPYYLPVKSAGNNRDFNGPPVGETYYRRNASGVFVSGTRPAGISNNDAYDIMSTVSNAKNILVVGAVNPVSVYSSPKDVVLTTFSSWGPTDDGRIKPDLVTDGVNVLSSIAAANNAYDIYTGTSMSSPAAAGSLLLLQEYYSRLHGGTFMRSATLKGIAIHTANEAGLNPGPDYQFGWGLLNMEQAAAVITANNTTHLIRENVLTNNNIDTFSVIASGDGTLRATICWTDVKGTVEPEATALNSTKKILVNDLDISIRKGATIYRPWTLNPLPARRADPAARGDNSLDNVEKIELPDIVPGEKYTIWIAHKGTLARGSQAYSLIVSGVSSQPYCASAATSTAGAKIDSVSFNKIRKKNIAGCTSYNNYTTITDTIETNQTIPLFVRLRSCDATSADKIVKAYLDLNNDGDFTDAGENVATSGVITGDGDFSSIVVLPAGLTTGTYSILRIVMQETNSAAAVTSCGSYARGETQDYKVYVAAPSTDLGVIELMSPANGECPSSEQYVAVRIRNFGRVARSNIPVSVEVKKGAAVVSNLSATFNGIVAAGDDAVYTFQTPMAFDANATYTFTSNTSFAGDQKPTNNENVATITISGNSAAPSGTAVVCNNNVLLRVSPTTSDLYTWYNTATATTPIATGTSVSTPTMAATYYLAKNDVSKKLGPADKLAFPAGGYLQLDTNEQVRLIFDATQPVLLDKARMYIGHAGKMKFLLRRITDFNYEDGSYSYFPAFDSTYTIDAYPTAPTPPIPGSDVLNNDPADLGAIFHLGMIAPTEGTWAIIATTTGTASVFRNRDITSPNYPYSIPGVIELTGNGAVDGTDPDYNQGFYYFFYNMSIQIAGCASARTAITPTTPTAPVITLNGTQLSSSAAAGNQWYINGTALAGAVSQNYTPVLSGTYTVRTTTNGCTLTSNAIPYVATSLPNADPSEIGLTVSPNPAPLGQFEMKLETRTRSNLDIKLLNTAGQSVYHQTKTGFIGRLSQTVNPGKIAPGVYYLQVVHDKKRYVRKVIVLK